MKKFFIFFTFLFLSIISVYAQDIIILRDGNTIESKIVEITPTEVKYLRHNQLDGPIRIIPLNDVLSIRYENGTNETYNSEKKFEKETKRENDEKIFHFSIGYGIEYGFNFIRYKPDYTKNTDFNFSIPVYLNFDFKFIEFETSFCYVYTLDVLKDEYSVFLFNWTNWTGLDLNFDLFGKYPFNINQHLTLYPLLGIGYNLGLYEVFYDYKFKREDLKAGDSLYLKIGGGLDYKIYSHLLFRVKFLYDIFLYNKVVSEIKSYYSIKFYETGPRIMLGISYVF